MLFVYNPFSGKGLIKNHLYDILQEFNALDMEIVIHPTKDRLDAFQYIAENEGKFDMIVCSGGDGTLNETVSGVMSYTGSKPPIGYIPSGSTNDFAKSLGIPKKMKHAARHIVNGHPDKVDIGKFNDRYFTYVAAIGAFTKVSYETPQDMKNILGHQAYIIEGIKELTMIKPMSLRIETEKETIEGDFIYGMITNSKSVGGVKGITGKDVSMNDGLFEITFIRQPQNPIQLNNIISGLLMNDYKGETVYFDHVSSVRVIAKEQQIPWVLDGEFGGNLREVNISVQKHAVDLILEKDVK